ncbi:ATP-dependent RNA helicase DbpA [Glaciecola sp. MH2013]|nr:ATP-dependent RNA helicase DbpA [Glaciecola sp. MH2013]
MSFKAINLNDELQAGLKAANYTEMTSTQAACLPDVLSGKDVAVQAKTGSGKTLAFALGLLSKIDVLAKSPQALIMCPTRELAEQVAEQIRLVGKRMSNLKVVSLVGGMPMGPQIVSLRYGASVVVGTPGRIMDHIGKRTVSLKKVNTLVLDEADRMLDMGFEDEMRVVMHHLSQTAQAATRQTLLFSATYPEQIQKITNQYQRDAKIIKVESAEKVANIEQQAYRILNEHRTQAVAALLTHHQIESTIVFCRTRRETRELCEELYQMGFAAAGLHGDLEQSERSQVLARFTNKTVSVLVATDVAARGLDIERVDLVINHRVSEDIDTHTHRIGRTGRAEEKGLAITLIDEAEEAKLDEIAAKTDATIKKLSIQSVRFHANRIREPEFVCIAVDGGKRDKLRPGDILGALTKEAEIPGTDIGKISISARHAYIAIKARSVKRALGQFRERKIKGKRFKARKLS